MQAKVLRRVDKKRDLWWFALDSQSECTFPSKERIEELAREYLGNTTQGESRFLRFRHRGADFLTLLIRSNAPSDIVAKFAENLEKEIETSPVES